MSNASARAAAAKRLVDDPLLIEAFDNVREAAIKVWEATPAADVHAREMAWLTVKAVGRIRAELQSIIDNGAIAAARVQAPVR